MNPMRFHPHDGNVVACSVGTQIHMINITAAKNNTTGTPNDDVAVKLMPTEHTKKVSCIDWSPDGSFMVISSEDFICVYDVTHWRAVATQATQTKISSCAFVVASGQASSNNKLRVAYGVYEYIYVWTFGDPSSQPQRTGGQGGHVAAIASTTELVASASHLKEQNLMLWTF